jgi:hypothetical protein
MAGVFVFIAIVSALSALKAMRAMKKSPYFFMRVQAEKRFRRYSSATLLFLLIAATTVVYGIQTPPVDQTLRMAMLANRKPPTEEVVRLVDRAAIVDAEIQAVTEELLTASEASAKVEIIENTTALPAEYDKFEPTISLQDNTALGNIAFSTDVDDEYQAVKPTEIFAEGNYTLYATFSYDDMADGMSWAWVWRLDGEVVEGGNELWAYGADGPGYIYLSPEEGFQNGRYSLDVWVNGELLTSSAAIMSNAAAAAAGN